MDGKGVREAPWAFIRAHEGGPSASPANQESLAPQLTPGSPQPPSMCVTSILSGYHPALKSGCTGTQNFVWLCGQTVVHEKLPPLDDLTVGMQLQQERH